MREPLKGRWWVGVAAGVALGLGTVVAVDAATDEASAQSKFTVSAEQLRINQRISQAAVRRSNESLDLLDPVRKSGARDTAPGWGTTQIRDGAVTAAKLETSVREGQPRWAVVAAGTGALTRGRGATAAAKLSTVGLYTVTFDRDVSACSYQVTVAPGDTTTTPVGQLSAWATPNAPTSVTVRTAQDSTTVGPTQGIPEDTNALPFHLAVLC
jgi:hypothetical protein